MKICFVATTVHVDPKLEESVGATTHTISLAKEFLKLGHQVYVFSEKHRGDKSHEIIDRIDIFRLNRAAGVDTKKIKKSNFRFIFRLFRFIPNILLALKISKFCKEKKVDLIFERGHSRGIGAFVSFLCGKPLILQMIDHIASLASIIKAKYIFAHSPVFFKENTRKKVVVVTCGIDPQIFFKVEKEKKYDLCYCGSFKEWDGLLDLIKTIRSLKEKGRNVKVLMLGDGKMAFEIKNRIKLENLQNNFFFPGKVPLNAVKFYLSNCRIGLAPYNTKISRKGKFEKFGFYFSPLKIFEYAACGLPVIAPDFDLILEIITDQGGLFFKEGNVFQLEKQIEKLLGSKKLQDSMSRYNQNTINKNYTWKIIASKMNDYLIKTRKNA